MPAAMLLHPASPPRPAALSVVLSNFEVVKAMAPCQTFKLTRTLALKRVGLHIGGSRGTTFLKLRLLEQPVHCQWANVNGFSDPT